eukprot:SAG11_NODE_2968_length_2804_cov_2.754159_3_plen_75_part_00
MRRLTEFDGHKMMSATKEGLKFGDEDYQKKLEDYLADEFKVPAPSPTLSALIQSTRWSESILSQVTGALLEPAR